MCEIAHPMTIRLKRLTKSLDLTMVTDERVYPILVRNVLKSEIFP